MDGHIGVVEVVFAIKDEMFVEIKQLRHCVVRLGKIRLIL